MAEGYETERQAAAAARHIYDTDPGAGAWSTGSLRLLEDACRAAGVQLGAYDYKLVLWLTGYEPSTCAVVAGLITRAHAGALTEAQLPVVLTALLDAAKWREQLAEEWAAKRGEFAAQAAAYRELAHELGGQR